MTEQIDSWEGEGGRLYKPSLRDAVVSVKRTLKDTRKPGELYGTRAGLTLCAINASVNKHNRKVKKARFKLGCIPVVFSNYNTGTR